MVVGLGVLEQLLRLTGTGTHPVTSAAEPACWLGTAQAACREQATDVQSSAAMQLGARWDLSAAARMFLGLACSARAAHAARPEASPSAPDLAALAWPGQDSIVNSALQELIWRPAGAPCRP